MSSLQSMTASITTIGQEIGLAGTNVCAVKGHNVIVSVGDDVSLAQFSNYRECIRTELRYAFSNKSHIIDEAEYGDGGVAI